MDCPDRSMRYSRSVLKIISLRWIGIAIFVFISLLFVSFYTWAEDSDEKEEAEGKTYVMEPIVVKGRRLRDVKMSTSAIWKHCPPVATAILLKDRHVSVTGPW